MTRRILRDDVFRWLGRELDELVGPNFEVPERR
jgi:hypothetical protein